MNTFLNYKAPNGETWRIEDATALMKAFEIVPTDLLNWHLVMSGTGQAWECLCRRYAIYEILTTHDTERMRPADDARIAKILGIKTAGVVDLLKQAGDYWRKHSKATASAGVKSVASSAVPPPMEKAEIARLLNLYGFLTSDEAEQLVIARRCVELSTFLDEDMLRSTAVSLINQERHLAALDETISGMNSEERKALPKQYQDLLKTRADIQEKIEKTMDRLGVWDTPETMKKRDAFSNSIAAVIEAVREYHADGSRERIDGVFTEGEVQVLLKSYDLRKPQYRPDLVLHTIPAAIEGLFDPNYREPKMPRHVHRRLRKSFDAALAVARQEDGDEIEELDVDPEEFPED